eukprot:2525942-Rhodomonas_salina.2
MPVYRHGLDTNTVLALRSGVILGHLAVLAVPASPHVTHDPRALVLIHHVPPRTQVYQHAPGSAESREFQYQGFCSTRDFRVVASLYRTYHSI